jgi:membrane-bound lytic murein transglycosylase D
MKRVWIIIVAGFLGWGCASKKPPTSPLVAASSTLGETVLRSTADARQMDASSPDHHVCSLYVAQKDGVGATLAAHGVSEPNAHDDLEAMTGCYDYPVVVNPAVRAWVRYYQGRGRNVMERFLERSGRWAPVIRRELARVGLPEDLLYLAIAESGLSSHAVSHANAIGPWQFIRSTGRRYGLRGDEWVEPRKDPWLSTQAAAEHLSWLYKRLGDWPLAAAGYNAGAGKLQRAVRIYDSRDFWQIRKGSYLKPETKQYVPKILAIALIAKHPEYFGFHPVEYQAPLEFDVVTTDRAVPLGLVASWTGASMRELHRLNPALLQDMTPPNRDWVVRVPQGAGEAAQAQLAAFQQQKHKLHRLRRGETLARLAKRYQVSTDDLMRVNAVQNPRSLDVGAPLLIPVQSGPAGGVSGNAAAALAE